MIKSDPNFSKPLIMWYLEEKRDLPWRATKDPYFIWLSEIILQQTRVAQGMPYYLAFVKQFPTVKLLADAPEEKVLKLWQGLGYYSRARNLHTTAKHIVYKLQNEFPKNYKDLLQLKGVGDYTASAIASICYNEASAVVDGNVYRVLARVYGIDTPINSTQGKKEFKALAQLLIDAKEPGTYNQAVMEFGARHCTPKNPDCDSCIFTSKCVANQKQKVSVLPVKLKKKAIKKVYFNYIVPITKEESTLLLQRKEKGIWQQLYEFPLVESNQELNIEMLLNSSKYVALQKDLSLESIVSYNENLIIHKLSHRHIYTRFWIAESKQLPKEACTIKKATNYPVPVLIEKFIRSFFNID